VDSKGEMLPHLPEKLDRHPRIALIVDPQNPEPSRFLELVEALAYQRCARIKSRRAKRNDRGFGAARHVEDCSGRPKK
jgi:hypothetical protein